MSGKARLIQFTWLTRNMLALTGGDLTIRLWNCQSNDTYLMPLPDLAELSLHSGAEHFTTLSYLANRSSSLLSAATNLGGIVFWRSNNHETSNPEDDWHFIGLVGLPGGSIEHSIWGDKFLYVHNGSSLYQIVQQQPCVVFRNEVLNA